MITNSNRILVVNPKVEVRVEYVVEPMLFGLLTTERIVRREKIGEELQIYADRVPGRVFINGQEFTPHL